MNDQINVHPSIKTFELFLAKIIRKKKCLFCDLELGSDAGFIVSKTATNHPILYHVNCWNKKTNAG
jgi:hypothetical protein